MPGRNLRDARSKLKHPLINPASISSLDRRSVIAAHWSAMGQLHCPAPLIPPSPSPTRRRPFVAKLPLVLPCLLCQSHALPPLLPPLRRLFIAVLVCNGQWSHPPAWPESPSAAAARIIGVTVPETAPLLPPQRRPFIAVLISDGAVRQSRADLLQQLLPLRVLHAAVARPEEVTDE